MQSIQLNLISRRIRVCTRCALHNNRIEGVPGEGPSNADIFIIGEAPGASENRSQNGTPFIGFAGTMLNFILVEAGISRGDCFITNMVKCWPGEGNPDPTPQEIETCRPWLDTQLDLVKPKGIITFGRYSTNKFMEFPPNGSMGRIQGSITRKFWDDDTPCYIMPLYHPSYLNRSKLEVPDVVNHLIRFKEIIYE